MSSVTTTSVVIMDSMHMGKNLGKIIEKCYQCSVVIMDSMHMVGVHLILGSTLLSDRNTFDGANTDS